MARGTYYTQQEVNDLITIFKQGATVDEIAEMTGRSSSGITLKLRRCGLSVVDGKYVPGIQVDKTTTGTPQKTLDDFSPREMIKYLHDKGYRIINGEIFWIQKTKINLADIIK